MSKESASESFDDILNDDSDLEQEPVAETPAVETPAASAEVVEEVVQPEIPEGYKQDARGVWHRADGTLASKGETAKFGTAAPQPEITGLGAKPAEVATEVPAVPFSYKALGQEHPLEGATLDKDGNLVVSKSSLATVQQMFARAQEFPLAQSREAKLNNEVQQHTKTNRELSTRAEKAEFAYRHLAAILDDPNRLTAFLTDEREQQYALRELQLGMRDVETARATADRASETQAQTAEQTAASELETISSAIDQLSKSPELAGFITPEDIEEAKGYFKEMRQAIVKTATDDSFAQYGIQKGEKYVVHQPMIQYLQRIGTERKKARDAIEAATKADKFNKAQIPAKTPAKKAPAVVAAGTKTEKKTKDWDSSFKDAWKAEDDEE